MTFNNASTIYNIQNILIYLDLTIFKTYIYIYNLKNVNL